MRGEHDLPALARRAQIAAALINAAFSLGQRPDGTEGWVDEGIASTACRIDDELVRITEGDRAEALGDGPIEGEER